MPKLYVAGPTIIDPRLFQPGLPPAVRRKREKTRESTVGRIYSEAQELMTPLGIDVGLPVAQQPLDMMKPRDFFREISQRILGAAAVLAVIRDADPSPYGEAMFAIGAGKRVWFLTSDADMEAIPRLFAGATDRIVRPFSARHDTFEEIAAYLSQAETSGTPQVSFS